MKGPSQISGIIVNDFKYIPDQTTLEEAIKTLEKADYGIITGKGDKIECLVTAEVLISLLEKNAIDGAKTTLWKLRRHWPPSVMVSLDGQEGIDKSYPSIRIDAPTISAGAKGAIFIKDNQVKYIMAFKGVHLVEDLREFWVKPLNIFDDLYCMSYSGLGGSIGVDCSKYCKICCEKVQYHSYSRQSPPTCPNGHKMIL